jgi:hypothetical protein
MKFLHDPGCCAEIRARLMKVTPETPRQWGKMNASQMICHLNDAFLGVMGEKAAEPLRGVNLWPLMKKFVLYAPVKWPQGVPTRPEYDQQIGGTQPVEFACDMQTLLLTIERFTAVPRDFEFAPHPMFKRLSDKDWMRWGYLHCDHHLRQFGA